MQRLMDSLDMVRRARERLDQEQRGLAWIRQDVTKCAEAYNAAHTTTTTPSGVRVERVTDLSARLRDIDNAEARLIPQLDVVLEAQNEFHHADREFRGELHGHLESLARESLQVVEELLADAVLDSIVDKMARSAYMSVLGMLGLKRS